jgi:hypothetical protein
MCDIRRSPTSRNPSKYVPVDNKDGVTLSQSFTIYDNRYILFRSRPDTVGQSQSAENCASRMPSWKAQAHRVFEAASTTVSRGNRLTNSIRPDSRQKYSWSTPSLLASLVDAMLVAHSRRIFSMPVRSGGAVNSRASYVASTRSASSTASGDSEK